MSDVVEQIRVVNEREFEDIDEAWAPGTGTSAGRMPWSGGAALRAASEAPGGRGQPRALRRKNAVQPADFECERWLRSRTPDPEVSEGARGRVLLVDEAGGKAPVGSAAP